MAGLLVAVGLNVLNAMPGWGLFFGICLPFDGPVLRLSFQNGGLLFMSTSFEAPDWGPAYAKLRTDSQSSDLYYMEMWPYFTESVPGYFALIIPLWELASAFGLMAFAGFAMRPVAREPDACPTCGYQTSIAQICPECGTRVDLKHPTPPERR